MKTNITYPTTTINYVVNDIAELSAHRMNDKKEVVFYYGSQILGTLVSGMCAHALAKHLSEYYKIPARVVFTGLENEGGIVKTVNGIKYSRMLCDHQPDGLKRFQEFVDSFRQMFTSVSGLSLIPTETNFYTDLQTKPLARSTLLNIIEKTDSILLLLNPLRKQIGVRFKCPECKYIDKHYRTQELLEFILKEKAIFRNECFEHGGYTRVLTPYNDEFFDVNGMVRNVIKEVVISSESETEGIYPVIVKGRDWVPTAIMVSEALELLGYSYEKRLQRMFTPLVLDWSGAKLSKSCSAEDKKEHAPFLSYPDLMSYYGVDGIEKLWVEVLSWTKDTRKFYRDYTTDFFTLLFKEGLFKPGIS
ncbi:hypothetical protein HZC30_07585 [Candidatus Woesearchaeota archaeon]|nr:hypothetical protein [Candidatus Woesearchaeota archaeon]